MWDSINVKRKTVQCFIALAACAAPMLPAMARDGQESTPSPPRSTMSDMVVTATRSEVERFKAPYVVDVVELNDFENNELFRTPTLALESIPNIMIQKTGYGQASPYIRGFTGFRTLLLFDGVRINNSVFRDGPNQYWNTLDEMSINRLEAVKGPVSALYGSDAIGGTVNALTSDVDLNLAPGEYSGRIYLRGATAEASLTERAEISTALSNKLFLNGGLTYADYGDLDGGGGIGRQENTGYESLAGDFKLVYTPDSDSKITLAHFNFMQDDAWRTHKTIYGIEWDDTTVGSELARILDQQHSLTYLKFAQDNLGGIVDSANITLSYQTTEEDRRRIRDDGRRDDQGFDLGTVGLDLQLESESEIGTWTYGLDWYYDSVDSYRDNYNADGTYSDSSIQGPVGDNATYDLVGVFIQDRISLSGDFDLTIGGRYTYAEADAETVEDPDTGNVIAIDGDWDDLVGNIRLNWYPDMERHWNVFTGVSQGFRAPNLSDLTRLDTARSGEIETPSPNVDPEFFVSYEIGVKAEYETIEFEAAYFYTDIKDMIIRTPTGDIVDGDLEVTKQNGGDGYVHGVELAADWNFHPQWTLFGNFAWLYGEVETYPTSDPVMETEPISRLAPPTGLIGLRWESQDGEVWAEAVCTIAGSADKLSTQDKGDTQRIPPGGTPGYQVIDLRGGWQATDQLQVWASLENLTNEAYRIHGSGVNEPGINFILACEYTF
jgi:hemoglobin/transferrin/lactoferrin receptor protein